MLVVFALILLAFVLFATERFPIDVTAILVMVLLMVLEPWTQISPREGISGFANPATITVLAMLILSTGINRTGIIQLIGRKMAAFAVGYLAVSHVADIALGAAVYFLAFALVGAVFTVYQVTYFDAVVDETVLPPDGGEGTALPADDDESSGEIHETSSEGASDFHGTVGADESR